MDFTRRGWVKLSRDCIIDPLISKDAEYLATWVYLLTTAAFEPTPALFGGHRIMLQPGQLVTGRKQISEKIGVTESKVQRIPKAFENAQLIEQQTGNKNRLISIVSWEETQNSERQDERQMNNTCTTNEQQLNTLEELRTKNIYNIPPYSPPRGDTPTPFDRFWKAYPKKVGKQAAQKAFKRVKVPVETLLTAIERQKRGDQWSRENGRYIPNPTTWLNQGRWDDEVITPVSISAQDGQDQRKEAFGEWT